MTAALGYEMMSRGKDATGILTVDRKARWKLRKDATAADVFLAGHQGIGQSATTLLLHTRLGTQGHKSNPLNNHPIISGDVIGIHNGMVFNDDDLYKHFDWERKGQVDSEAIFAALNNLELYEALKNINGSWAIAWIDVGDDPRRLWLARGSSSPLCYALTANGSVVFASTSKGVEQAFAFGGIDGKPHVVYAPEGFLAHVEPDGGLMVMEAFDHTGDNAIGARKRTYVSTGKSTGRVYTAGGWTDVDDWSDTWYRGKNKGSDAEPFPIGKRDPDKPFPYCREYIPPATAANQVAGDVRKYVDGGGVWHYEQCQGSGRWTEIARFEKDVTEPTTLRLVKDEPKPEPEQTSIAQTVATEAKELTASTPTAQERAAERRRQRVEAIVGTDDDEGEAIPFDWEEDLDLKHSYAEVGDLISFRKSDLGSANETGYIAAEVMGEDGDELIVDFRMARLHKESMYEVMYRPGRSSFTTTEKGATV